MSAKRFALSVVIVCLCASGRAENASAPIGEPVLESPTLHCLGMYWIVKGDDNANAVINVEYQKSGDKEWKKGPPLFRVEKGAHKPEKGQSKLDVPKDGWLFAGSIFILEPNTTYDIKLKLEDADGGSVEKTLHEKTIAEPMQPADAKTRHVVPGSGGGSGSQEDPYKGLVEAQSHAVPGDLFLLAPGSYEGTFTADRSGDPGKPIIWRGNGRGEVILDAKGTAEKPVERVVSAGDIHDVWFEKLTLRNAHYGIVVHRSCRIVVRRCHIHNVEYGLTWTNNDKDTTNGFFVSDNVIEGPSTWPRTKGIENARGIQATGTGHVVCYNRIRGFADAMDTFGSQRCAAIDFHNNDCSECTDDGCEMDYSERNTRCFNNRFTNIFQGISVQPIFGGPVYIFRNALYNVVAEPFKMHNSPSGALMIHNTSVKKGMPLTLYTGEKVRNCVYRNNIFIGTDSNYCYENTAPMEKCDFDYDGFGGGPFKSFLKWNNQKYATIEDVHKSAPVEKHSVLVDPATAFASGVKQPDDEKKQQAVSVNDMRLKEGTAAIDAGEVLPGFNDGFKDKAPDLGAYEFGAEMPQYGPRLEK